MDFSYESGVAIALLIGVVKVVVSTAQLTSTKAKNLKQVGLYYSCIQGTWVDRRGNAFKYTLYITYMLIVAPVFSWLSVISAVGSYLWHLAKRQPIPENVKEIQYKLGATPLNKEQVTELMTELGKLHGASAAQIRLDIEQNTLSDDEESEIELELSNDEYGRSTMTLDRDAKQVHFYGHPHDYTTVCRSTSEFRIDGTKVEWRTLAESVEHMGEKKRYKVLDNVVQEAEIRKYHEGAIVSLIKPDEIISNLKREVEWHEVRSQTVRYFLLANGSDISEFEFRRYLQTEKQRIEEGCRKILLEINEVDGVISETDEGYEVNYKDKEDNDHCERLSGLFDEDKWAQRSISEYEFLKKKLALAEIDKWLSRAKKAA